MHVRPAGAEDLDGIAAALAAAFHDDPVMCWLFGDTPPRPQRYSQVYFRHEARRHLKHRLVLTADGTPAASLWDPPGHWKSSPLDVLSAVPGLVRGLGRRSLAALRGLSAMESFHADYPSHYYLAIIGTHPKRQGEGLGRRLMEPVLERCDAEGVGAYLESSKESNIAYYERFGFEVEGTIDFPKGPRLWPMWRDPLPPAHLGS